MKRRITVAPIREFLLWVEGEHAATTQKIKRLLFEKPGGSEAEFVRYSVDVLGRMDILSDPEPVSRADYDRFLYTGTLARDVGSH